jgi:hypothetical protein
VRDLWLPERIGPNPTSALSKAISITGPLEMKENSSFSFIIEHHSLLQRLQKVSPVASGIPGDERCGRRTLSILRL